MISATTATQKKVAIVTCSTRKPRANPFISAHVLAILEPHAPSNVSLSFLDIAEQGLPLYDEPNVPSTFPPEDPTPHYLYPHTRAWSEKVRQFDAFIFVTPQYNWSVPASLKNALDYLFYEWKGKPAAVISYGGHGGNKAADHLRGIFGGLRMTPVMTSVMLPIPVRSFTQDANAQQKVPEAVALAWKETGKEEEMKKVLEEIVQMFQ
ncbi:hypothetical protein BGZ83_008049 [Gryganskiella cystojenkinii]|nr:hypothetical protein BGZ83_008049 [Gryganskiella cystojenkinii]